MATVPRDSSNVGSHSTSMQESSSSKEVTDDGTEISKSSFKKEESETKIEETSKSVITSSVKSSAVKMTSSSSTTTSGGNNLPISMGPSADDLMKQQEDFLQKSLMESQDRFLQQQQQMMQQVQKQDISQLTQKKVVGMTSKMVVQESVEEEQGKAVGALDANGNQVEGEATARPEEEVPDTCPSAPTTSTTTTNNTTTTTVVDNNDLIASETTMKEEEEGEATVAEEMDEKEETQVKEMAKEENEEEERGKIIDEEPPTVVDTMTKATSETTAEVTSSMEESSETAKKFDETIDQNVASTESRTHTTEIEQESIKNTLREIISEIEQAVVSEVMTSDSTEKTETKKEDMSEKMYYQAIVSNSESVNPSNINGVSIESNQVDITDQLRQEKTTSTTGLLLSGFKEETIQKSFSPPRILQTPSSFIKNVHPPISQVDLPPIQQLPPLEDLSTKLPTHKTPIQISKTLPKQCPISSKTLANEEQTSEERMTTENLMHLWQSVQIAHELNQVLGSKTNGPVAPPMQNGGGVHEEESRKQKTVEKEESSMEKEFHSEKLMDGESTTTDYSRETVTTTSSSHTKHINFEKLFTPPSDSGELTPRSRNRRMYSSSSFYLPSHPTVEEQFELARRISRSLADSSNKQSKGQSMYVNRKKRSVKWVHDGSDGVGGGGGGGQAPNGVGPETPADDKPLSFKIPSMGTQEVHFKEKSTSSGLRLVMNPRGQVQDLASLRRQGIPVEPGPISPEVVFDLVKDLNSPKGRGAELFAKRRKRSENWVVDETTVKSSSSSMMMESHQSSSMSSSMNTIKQAPAPMTPLPPPSYLDQKRVEHIQKLNQIQERFTQPKLRLVKSPWEAALETGSVDTAFQEVTPPVIGPPTLGSTTAAEVVDTVVRAARAISPMPTHVSSAPTFPPVPPAPLFNAAPAYIPAPPPPQQMMHRTAPPPPSSSTANFAAGDIYRPKAPRGWQNTEPRYSAPQMSQRQEQQPPLPPAPQPQMTAAPTQRIQLSNLANYNTAARGWQRDSDYYRPVTFASKV